MIPAHSTSLTSKVPQWIWAIFPLALLVILIALFFLLNPLAFFSGAFPPLEDLAIQRVIFPAQDRIQLQVINGGPDPVTIAQLLIDDAYWNYEIAPRSTLERLQQATVDVNYPWVDGEPLSLALVTSTGLTFTADVEVAVQSPQNDAAVVIAYGLLGIYVGVIPVSLGMLWYPFLRRVDRRWVNAFLALTVGLLVFLLVDTLVEALEMAAEVPGVFQGVPMVIFGMLLALGILLAASRRQGGESPVAIATFIALGIGLHNLGEGLAIGAAFATGAAALGSFLVVGFTLHNITEGIGIATPLARTERPPVSTFIWLAVLAGAPAMAGAWIGGFAFNPFVAAVFLSLGAGAILQVIWEVSRLLLKDAQQQKMAVVTWLNFTSLTAGILIMYLTAFLVKF